MAQQERAAASLTDCLERLIQELDEDSGDRPVMADEHTFFALVDEAESDPTTDPQMLEDAAGRFAEHCIAPYLHSSDPGLILRELSGLLEIHHRGSIQIESLEPTDDGTEAIVSITRLDPEGNRAPPTRFDQALIQESLLGQHPRTTIEPLEQHEDKSRRFRILLAE